MLLEWVQNRELYERWERECKPPPEKKEKKLANKSSKILKLEMPK